MRSGWLRCVAAASAIVFLLSCGGGTSKKSAFIYLASQGTSPGTVSAYSINLKNGTLSSSNGALTPVGKSAATGIQPTALLFDPTNTFAYTANAGSDNISLLTLNNDGSLAASSSTTSVSPGVRPIALAMDPAAHFLFVANEGTPSVTAGTISVFSIGSGGALTAVAGSPFPISETSPPLLVTPNLPEPTALAVSNQGNFLYVTDQSNGAVLGYSFDTNGVLSPVPGGAFLVGTAPDVVFSPPAGNFLYVGNAVSSDIYEFTINSDGSLSPIVAVGATRQSIAATGQGPIAMLSDPSAKYIFVLANGGNQVWGYTFNRVTGILSPIATSGTVSTGAGPVAFALRSDGSTNGNFWLFTSNSGASSISTFSLVFTTGALNPLPQLTTPLAPAGIAAR